ncbi:MAG: hypothetical protein OJF55_002199 [Rhodanobacteraceae bacterium]|jgi:hypothetical protein|nr:MAG: hypothetical protein OJF55_002199 [Rhodanobacteraceae bacterium]
MNVQDSALGTPAGIDAAPRIETLAFTPRKESWVASSGGWFYKMFRSSDDPARDWLDPVCIEKARREYADMLLLHRFSKHVCRPVRLDHACVVYPHLSGPDMRAMLQMRGCTSAQRAAALRDAVTLLARLHAETGEALDYPVKDYLRHSYLTPDAEVLARITARERTLFIGGFEVRNFRFDRQRNAWFFFDPQHVFLGIPEDDLARFVISLLMVNWGKGGSLRIWRDFDVTDLVATYQQASARTQDPLLLNHCLRENIAMRRHFAEKALRGMHGAGRLIGRPYLSAYFLQLEKWVAKHEL